ncbi:MAG: SDR family NAD(P)-dependent oxidoreductase [Gammaproteobacteria bacterium]|nr:SDR family NAD(P)-dependent oxidoreductase [Gammaproteobacteria bacterium]
MRRAIRDSVVVVTGASSGIGRATALALGAHGANVAVAARREALLTDLAAEIAASGGQALAVPIDVTDRDQVRGLIERTVQRWGRIDVVVANAGIWLKAPVEATTAADWHAVMAVNYFGALNTALEALPFLEQGGQLVFVNSLDGKKGVPLEAAYSAAKHALSGFAGVARQELAARGIAVTSIYPGRVDTAPFEGLRVPKIQKKMPPEKVATAVLSAIRRPRSEVYVPAFSGRVYAWLGTVAPNMSDRLTALFNLQGWT